MKTPKEKADELVGQYRMILMNEDTECGNEILCTVIAIKCALICVDEMIDICYWGNHERKKEFTDTFDLPDKFFVTFCEEVKQAIIKL